MIQVPCGFCGRIDAVSDDLAGTSHACSQCGGKSVVPMPAAPPPPPPPPPDPAIAGMATWTIASAVLSVLCACLFTPLTLLLGFLTISRAHVDPITHAVPRRKAIWAMALSGVVLVAETGGFVAWGMHLNRVEAQQVAAADAAYDRGDFEEARRLYEALPKLYSHGIRARVEARLGRCLWAKGEREGAVELFRKARQSDPDLVFSCGDPEVNEAFRTLKP